MTDCAETRALLALLVKNEDRAWLEVRSLRLWERTACARAARRLAEMCDACDGGKGPPISELVDRSFRLKRTTRFGRSGPPCG